MHGEHASGAETPEMISLMGYSLARESGQFKEGIALCEKAISLNPRLTDHYLHLGRIYLLANRRERALRAFKVGLKIKKDQRIIAELKRMGLRKPPVLTSLPREHVLNVFAGKMLKMLRMR